MPITREARHLSGNDIGRTIAYKVGESQIHGLLYGFNPEANLINDTTYGDLYAGRENWILGKKVITVKVLSGSETTTHHLNMDHPITITGTETPDGLNLHKSVLDQDR